MNHINTINRVVTIVASTVEHIPSEATYGGKGTLY